MVILYSMKRPIFVRPFSDAERETLEAGLRPQRCLHPAPHHAAAPRRWPDSVRGDRADGPH